MSIVWIDDVLKKPESEQEQSPQAAQQPPVGANIVWVDELRSNFERSPQPTPEAPVEPQAPQEPVELTPMPLDKEVDPEMPWVPEEEPKAEVPPLEPGQYSEHTFATPYGPAFMPDAFKQTAERRRKPEGAVPLPGAPMPPVQEFRPISIGNEVFFVHPRAEKALTLNEFERLAVAGRPPLRDPSELPPLAAREEPVLPHPDAPELRAQDPEQQALIELQRKKYSTVGQALSGFAEVLTDWIRGGGELSPEMQKELPAILMVLEPELRVGAGEMVPATGGDWLRWFFTHPPMPGEPFTIKAPLKSGVRMGREAIPTLLSLAALTAADTNKVIVQPMVETLKQGFNIVSSEDPFPDAEPLKAFDEATVRVGEMIGELSGFFAKSAGSVVLLAPGVKQTLQVAGLNRLLAEAQDAWNETWQQSPWMGLLGLYAVGHKTLRVKRMYELGRTLRELSKRLEEEGKLREAAAELAKARHLEQVAEVELRWVDDFTHRYERLKAEGAPEYLLREMEQELQLVSTATNALEALGLREELPYLTHNDLIAIGQRLMAAKEGGPEAVARATRGVYEYAKWRAEEAWKQVEKHEMTQFERDVELAKSILGDQAKMMSEEELADYGRKARELGHAEEKKGRIGQGVREPLREGTEEGREGPDGGTVGRDLSQHGKKSKVEGAKEGTEVGPDNPAKFLLDQIDLGEKASVRSNRLKTAFKFLQKLSETRLRDAERRLLEEMQTASNPEMLVARLRVLHAVMRDKGWEPSEAALKAVRESGVAPDGLIESIIGSVTPKSSKKDRDMVVNALSRFETEDLLRVFKELWREKERLEEAGKKSRAFQYKFDVLGDALWSSKDFDYRLVERIKQELEAEKKGIVEGPDLEVLSLKDLNDLIETVVKVGPTAGVKFKGLELKTLDDSARVVAKSLRKGDRVVDPEGESFRVDEVAHHGGNAYTIMLVSELDGHVEAKAPLDLFHFRAGPEGRVYYRVARGGNIRGRVERQPPLTVKAFDVYEGMDGSRYRVELALVYDAGKAKARLYVEDLNSGDSKSIDLPVGALSSWVYPDMKQGITSYSLEALKAAYKRLDVPIDSIFSTQLLGAFFENLDAAITKYRYSVWGRAILDRSEYAKAGGFKALAEYIESLKEDPDLVFEARLPRGAKHYELRSAVDIRRLAPIVKAGLRDLIRFHGRTQEAVEMIIDWMKRDPHPVFQDNLFKDWLLMDRHVTRQLSRKLATDPFVREMMDLYDQLTVPTAPKAPLTAEQWKVVRNGLEAGLYKLRRLTDFGEFERDLRIQLGMPIEFLTDEDVKIYLGLPPGEARARFLLTVVARHSKILQRVLKENEVVFVDRNSPQEHKNVIKNYGGVYDKDTKRIYVAVEDMKTGTKFDTGQVFGTLIHEAHHAHAAKVGDRVPYETASRAVYGKTLPSDFYRFHPEEARSNYLAALMFDRVTKALLSRVTKWEDITNLLAPVSESYWKTYGVDARSAEMLAERVLTRSATHLRSSLLWKYFHSLDDEGVWLRMGILDDDLVKAVGQEIADLVRTGVVGTQKLERMREAGKVPLGTKLDRAKTLLMRRFVDQQFTSKDLFDKIGGEQAHRTWTKLVLQKGATAAARIFLKEAHGEIWKGLTMTEKRSLDAYIRLLRTFELMQPVAGESTKARLARIGPLPGGMTPEEVTAAILAWPKVAARVYGLNERRALEVARRAQAFFDRSRQLLQMLREHELITQELYEKLAGKNYIRTRQAYELLEAIDPPQEVHFGGRTITVGDSGVEHIRRARPGEIIEMDASILLAEMAVRVFGRIFKNDANKELLKLAQQNPENGLVKAVPSYTKEELKVKKKNMKVEDWKKFKEGIRRPEGWKEVELFVDGKKWKLYMDPWFAQGWITSSTVASGDFLRFLKVVSGSPLLRMTATGMNPAFALLNLPRDMTLSWLSAQYKDANGKWRSIYSPIVPIAALQQVRDLLPWAIKEVAKRGKEWEDYLMRGGGVDFMVGYGRMFRKAFGVKTTMQRLGDYLSFLGEVSEGAMRLALRRQALRRIAQRDGIPLHELLSDEGKVKYSHLWDEATAYARDYFDPSQGGEFIRASDAALPYLNAGVQAARSVFRAGKRSPTETAMKLGQAWLMFEGIVSATLANADQDFYDDIPDDVKRRFLILPMPRAFWYTNEVGELVRPYVKIPLDQSMRWLWSLILWRNGALSWADVRKAFLEFTPLAEMPAPPTLSAAVAILGGYDVRRLEKVWNGPEVDAPREWRQEFGPKDGTPEALRLVGEYTGTSPERLRAALGNLMSMNNPYVMLIGGWLNEMAEDSVPPEVWQEHIARWPLLKSFIGLSSVAVRGLKEGREAELKERGDYEVVRRGLQEILDRAIFRSKGTEERMTGVQEAIRYVVDRSLERPEWKDALKDELKFHLKWHESPYYRFYARLRGMQPEVAARMAWTSVLEPVKDVEERRRLIVDMAKVPGLMSQRFKQELWRVSGGDLFGYKEDQQFTQPGGAVQQADRP
ncbi:MAG: hypothetical protein KatS3mg015_2785 [Fimbriimonadales bacterium]|nr:MAG: hypothetical protein KatS3mg015_2785 [Fimbriimonadales bacterium]